MNIAIEELKTKFGKKILINEKLSNYSWFNVGGPAEIFFKPDSVEDIHFFIKTLKPQKFIVLGAGSNTLVNDDTYNGIVIKLGKNFSNTSLLPSGVIVAGSSCTDKKLSEFDKKNKALG